MTALDSAKRPDPFKVMIITTPKDVFFDQMKDIHSVLDQVQDTLPDLAAWASEASLKGHLDRHRTAVEQQRQEIKAIFEAHNVEAGDDVCKAMEGLIEGGNQHIEMAGDATVRDILLIAHTNRIAHYLVAAFEFTSAIAETAGLRPESMVLADLLEGHRNFMRDLQEIGLKTFGIPVGGLR